MRVVGIFNVSQYVLVRAALYSLIELKLIKTTPGYGNDFGFILLRNPYLLLHELKGKIDPGIYGTAVARAAKYGAGKEIRGSEQWKTTYI